MKKLFTVLFLCLCAKSYAQTTFSRIEQPEVVKVLGSIEDMQIVKGRHLQVSVFKTSNAPGSVGLSETHEVSHNLVICVAEYDEYPDKKVYTIGSFINPRILKKVDADEIVNLLVESGLPDQRKRSKIVISRDEVRLE